jgi:hypothetical protein
MKKYYFITIQAMYKNSLHTWNQVIDISPMDFLKQCEDVSVKEENAYYRNFIVLNTCLISEEEYNTYKGQF